MFVEPHRSRGLRDTTINAYLRTLRAALNRAALRTNPPVLPRVPIMIEMCDQATPIPTALTKEEVELLLSHAEESSIPTARDLMETHVVSVTPDTPLIDVHRLFVEEEISGAPVLDDLGVVVGVISAADLLRTITEEHDSVLMETDYFRNSLAFSSPDWAWVPEDFQDRLRELRVSDEMDEGVISVAPRTPAPEIARCMREARVHRLFVAEDGRLLGILSVFDLLTIEDWKL